MGKSIFISQKVIFTSRPWETFCHVFVVSCLLESYKWSRAVGRGGETSLVWVLGEQITAFCAQRIFLDRDPSPLALPAEVWCRWGFGCGTQSPPRELPATRPGGPAPALPLGRDQGFSALGAGLGAGEPESPRGAKGVRPFPASSRARLPPRPEVCVDTRGQRI